MPSDQTTTESESRLSALVEAGMTVASGLDLDAVLGRLLDLTRALTGARYAAVGVLDATGARIEQFITVGLTEGQRAQIGHPPVGRGILGVLITDAEPLRLADLGSDPRSTGFPPNHPPMASFLGVPVVAGGTVFGNLYLTDKGEGEFTEQDERLCVTLAAQAGVAVHNARLYRQATDRAQELQRAVRELSSIHDIADSILADTPRDETLSLIAERARIALECRLVGVALPDPGGATLTYVAAAGDGRDQVAGVQVSVAESRIGAAMRARRSVTVDDFGPDANAARPAVEATGIRSQVIVPLVHRSRPLGVMMAADKADDRRFTDEDRGVLEAYATRGVLALVMGDVLQAERDRVEAEGRLHAAELRDAARRETLRRVVDAQERERRRIARELHDETGQSLATVLMGLRLLRQDDDDAGAVIDDLRETVTSAIQELRSLAVELRPKALDDFGLGAAIERLTDTYSRRTGIDVDVHLEGLDERLSEEVESALYRIVQEGLTNVAKHAGAAHVSVIVRRVPGRVVLLVEDDGDGFDPGAASDGLGLVSMRERADLVSGTYRVESSAGKGTTIAVEVPV